MICAAVKVMHDSMGSSYPKYTNVTVKCLMKMANNVQSAIPPFTEDSFFYEESTKQPLKVPDVLLEMDTFWRAYPRGHASYQKLGNENPLKLIKSYIIEICKKLNDKVLDELHLISDLNTSEVLVLICKALKRSERDVLAELAVAAKKENIR